VADPSPLDGALKKLALLSAVCLIFACESPTMPRTSSVPVKPAAAVVYNVRDQRVAGVINDCTGEGFAFDVTFSDLLGVTENANGFHATRHASIHGQAVSLLTGATYNVSDVINMTLDIGAADNFTFQDRFIMIGMGSVPNEVAHFQTHYTVTPNGDVTSSYDHFTLQCQE